MKVAIQAFTVNILFVVIFAILYRALPKNHFICSQSNYTPKFIDYFGLSITTQAGVGITSLTPISNLAKLLLIFQQFFIISFNIILLYFLLFIHKEEKIVTKK